MSPVIYGIAEPALREDERAFFRAADPVGYILFRRNVVDRAQLRALTDSLRALHGRDDLPILIDQEGGRVARLAPPEWPLFPNAEAFDRLYQVAPISAMEAARSNARAIALMLREVGINVDCLPLIDVRDAAAHDIIGDRALGHDPLQVASLGRAVLDGLRDGGCVGVMKHVPGHGRAASDSHLELPVVDVDRAALARDILPFERLNDAPMAMTAHVVYPAWDGANCASLSPTIIADVIRGEIGFDGLLMSDDLGMHALTGDFGVRATGVLDAGCDVALHCSGDMHEMREIAAAVGAVGPQAAARLERAMAWARYNDGTSFAESVLHRDALLALA